MHAPEGIRVQGYRVASGLIRVRGNLGRMMVPHPRRSNRKLREPPADATRELIKEEEEEEEGIGELIGVESKD